MAAAPAHDLPRGRDAVVIPFPSSPHRQLTLFRLCVNCGATLSRYNTDEDDLCQACRRRWQSQPEYDARTDPQFLARVADLLMANYRRPVLVGRELGVDVWVVGEAVKALRKLGFCITARKGIPGYTLTGWQRPRRQAS